VAGEWVGLMSASSGPLVSEAAKQNPLRAQTDGEGRFRFFVEPGVRYRLVWGIERGIDHGWLGDVLPDPDAELDAVLPGGRTDHTVTRGRLLGPAGKPVADFPLRLVPEYGRPLDARTNASGHFTFDTSTTPVGQGVLVVDPGAPKTGMAPPLEPVRDDGREQLVQLGPTASLTGRVVAEGDDGKPLAGAVVEVRPGFMSGQVWRTTTDDDGRYRVSGLPAGEYKYWADHEAYADQPPRGDWFFERTVEVGAGETADASAFAMRPRAELRGIVRGLDGQPVPLAWVAGLTEAGDSSEGHRRVRTDLLGRFTLSFGRFHSTEPKTRIEAYHPRLGTGGVEIDWPEPGRSVQDLTIRLHGSTRLVVDGVDPDGQPVDKVNVRAQLGAVNLHAFPQNADHDFGWVPLTGPDQPIRLVMAGAAAHSGHVFQNQRLVQPGYHEGMGPFYLPSVGEVAGRLDEVTRQTLTVRQDELFRIRGQLAGPGWEATRQGGIFFFAGSIPDPVTEAFTQDLINHERSSQPMRGGSSYIRFDSKEKTWRHLTQVSVDGQGRWSVFTTRSATRGLLPFFESSARVEEVAAEIEAGKPVQLGVVFVTDDGRFTVLHRLTVPGGRELTELESSIAVEDFLPLAEARD
jgi:hypothetical protein